MPELPIPGSNFLKGATGMPIVRQITLLVALAASVAIAMFVAFWMQAPDYRPISGPTSPDATADMIRALDARAIDYTIDQRTGVVMVPSDAFYSARMALADGQALPGPQAGYELMDRETSTFGVSQFREYNEHRRAIEGELAKSITTIIAVAQARVILAMPKTTTFLRDRRKPSASVTVTLKPGRSLTSDQVRGVMNLVAAAVPELDPNDVVVVDQTGDLLSADAEDESRLRSQRDMQFVRTLENDLHEKVVNILTPWVGSDRFTAEVHAEVDFTRTERTEEAYDPETNAVRSEEQMEERSFGVESTVGGVPGTLSNQPPEFGTVPVEEGVEETERSSRVRAIRNFEVDRTVSYVQSPVGQLQRLTVSVVVDDRIGPVDEETGESTMVPWTEEDIGNLTAAVQSAVGFRAERGDAVNVVNRAFFRVPVEETAAVPFWEQVWFSDLLKQVLGGIAIIVVIFGLLRPLYRNLSQAGELVREQQSLAIADMTQMREAAMQEAVPGLPTPIALDPEDTSAAKMETVRNLISEDPERVAQVVKSWVSDNE